MPVLIKSSFEIFDSMEITVDLNVIAVMQIFGILVSDFSFYFLSAFSDNRSIVIPSLFGSRNPSECLPFINPGVEEGNVEAGRTWIYWWARSQNILFNCKLLKSDRFKCWCGLAIKSTSIQVMAFRCVSHWHSLASSFVESIINKPTKCRRCKQSRKSQTNGPFDIIHGASWMNRSHGALNDIYSLNGTVRDARKMQIPDIYLMIY